MHLIRKVLPNRKYKIYQLYHSCQDARFILRRQIRIVCCSKNIKNIKNIKNKSHWWKVRDMTSNMKKVFFFDNEELSWLADVDQKAPVNVQSLIMLMPTWGHKRLVWHPAAVL